MTIMVMPEGVQFEPVHHLHHHLINTKVCFNLFDVKKQDFLSGDDLGDIMRCGYRFFVKNMDLICRAMGFRPTDEELKDLLEEVKITNLPIDQLSYWPIGQMANLPIT